MLRRTFLSAGSAAAAGLAASRDPRPNIIFVLADDLRHDGLGCTGHPFARTPNIDRLAREGATYTNYFTATPLCSPSRASFLTGLYPHQHRIVNNDKIGLSEISHTLITFPRVLRESGYETAFIGKWHMGFDDTRRAGFDHWISFRGQGLYIDPLVNVDGQRRQLRGYMTDFLNQSAVRFLERSRTAPFALCLCHKAVHYPYLPATRHDNLYAGASYPVPANASDDLSGKPVLRRVTTRPDVLRMEDSIPEPQESRRGRPRTRDDVIRDQARCLASLDDGMAAIFTALEKTGALHHTLIVFAGDNGYSLGEHGQFDNKRWAWEECIRIPFLARYPARIPAGVKREHLALNIDLAPTLYELAGVKPPEPVHGRSLVPTFKDADVPLRESMLLEHFLEKVGPRVPDWQCIRTRTHKYIRYRGLESMDELYDLAADPLELRNLAAQPSSRDTRQQLASELKRLASSTGGRELDF